MVVPVKRLSQAKSRTRLRAHVREALAMDLARHTVSVACAHPWIAGVIVVTDDLDVSSALRGFGAVTTPEPPEGGLVVAARHGMQLAATLFDTDHVAVMVSDLPRLSADDLTDVIDEYLGTRVPLFVADHHGIGTTFVIQERMSLRCAFGPASSSAHEALGFRPATSSLAGLRFDLDTPEDLRAMQRAHEAHELVPEAATS